MVTTALRLALESLRSNCPSPRPNSSPSRRRKCVHVLHFQGRLGEIHQSRLTATREFPSSHSMSVFSWPTFLCRVEGSSLTAVAKSNEGNVNEEPVKYDCKRPTATTATRWRHYTSGIKGERVIDSDKRPNSPLHVDALPASTNPLRQAHPRFPGWQDDGEHVL
jgi:hypothetical protein